MISCAFEDGGKANLRHVVVDAIVLNAARDSILMVKRAPHLLDGGKWGLVGGFLDRDETTKVAVIREVKEETGYDATILRFLKTIDNPERGDDRQNVAFVYEVVAGEQTGKPDDESTEIKWFTFDKIPQKETIAFDHSSIISEYLSVWKNQ